MPESEYEHLQEEIRGLVIEPKIQAFESKYGDKDYHIRLKFDEFTCLCPRTGLPDFATILIDYVPDKLIAESRSLKFYLNAYRNVGIFNEHVVNKILEDLVEACRPRFVEVIGRFNLRGGIGITVSASHGDESLRRIFE
ncbi:MAG: NADPH-dependent 7-cyano-7-deazaguanine reductase QueF [Thermoplasmata archaeon]|nr:NADPH-dependent 7-cyano-7-deazaguanine reductase QueF [Thermoplasmata archaeon]